MLDGTYRLSFGWGNDAESMDRGFSQTFYRQRLYESVLGFQDLEDFMQNYWEKWALSKGTPSPLVLNTHPVLES